MALIFGSGEPVSRVRRGLDVKGKVNLGLDEIVVPVATTIDLTIPPIRRSPVRWWAFRSVPAIVGELGRFRIFHQNATDQVIDYISVTSSTGMSIRVGHGPGGDVNGLAVRTTELMDADTGGVISRPVGILTLADSITPTSIGTVLFGARVLPGSTAVILERRALVLPAMPEPADPITNAPTLTIESLDANELFEVSISGLLYDAIPITFRT